MKTVVKILVGIIAAIALGIGGFKLMQKIEHDQMVEIVKSEEVKEIIEDNLYYIDSDSFTEKGVIKSYKIDEDSIRHNPMGGIDFEVYLNSDKDLIVYYGLEKDMEGQIKYSGGGYTKEVKDLLESKE
ncbi:TPA: DUF1310 family protein [Streptococcus suis]|nr:DUF1310 family protein [Streptococcus suis]HEM3667707.1 DUF1310 family protein [Streptococcus suis]HEM3722479.1 DUF1310 family protein [Streptococcus suis]